MPEMAEAAGAVLLIAFGGPNHPDEIRPFLTRVTRGLPIPPARLEEVARHYEAVGGRSPLTEITLRQAAALRASLRKRNRALPVYVGFRNSAPFFIDALRAMRGDGIACAVGVILSSHRTEASWERYQQNIADARTDLGAGAPEVVYGPGWHDHPLFVRTWVDSIKTAFSQCTGPRDATPLVFTAHSVPLAMAARSPYVAQLETSARLIAAGLGHDRWSLAFQSRSGRPTDPWLEPDIVAVVRELAAGRCKELVVAPIGFVCDHVEVLYDLDIQARRTAGDLGVSLIRATCPNDRPTFIETIADAVERCLYDDAK